MIDVTTTATLRSEILDRTLSSFKENMIKDWPCRLILNIDPVGDDTAENVINVAKKHFSTVLVNRPKSPSFPKAFLWCFRQATSKYIFNLEDDWELVKEVDLQEMIDIMEQDNRLAILRLPYRISTEDSKNWNLFFPWNGRYFECPEDRKIAGGFCGHPSLIRCSFFAKCLGEINPSSNPEKQFHSGGSEFMKQIVVAHKFGVFQKQNETQYINDIGRNWLAGTEWRKKGNKAFFTEWEKPKKTGE